MTETVSIRKLVFHPTGERRAGEPVDGAYVAPDGRTAGIVRNGSVNLAPWVTP